MEKHAFISVDLYEQHKHIRPHAVSVGNSKVITYDQADKASMRALAESTGFEIKEDQVSNAVIAAIELGIDAIYVVTTPVAREITAYFNDGDL